MALRFPDFDPVAVEIGPLAIRWYALAYVAGILLGWQYVKLLARRGYARLTEAEVDDFVLWATVGVVLGGRIGYVLFYRPDLLIDDPVGVIRIWQGGMSFHGGMLGVVIALVLFARRRRLPILAVADPVAAATPIGLFFGRVANFINGELFGRVSDMPWAMVFPHGGPEPRHPSQLYQAGLEGLLLFAVLAWLTLAAGAHRRTGLLTGTFLAGYGLARIIGEFFRQPDAHIGFLSGGATMGQWLSLPMIVAGLWLMVRARRDPA